MDRVLQYDPNGNLIAIDSTASGTGCAVNDTIFCSRFESDSTPGADNRSFVYDELDRLLEVINPQRPDQFSYDPLGNLRSASDLGSWSYDASNRISSRIHAGTSYPHTWDERGNLTHDGERSYTWNRASELVADGSGGQYAYDANGWRVYQKQAAGAPIYSVYDHQQRLMVHLDAQTGTRTEFIYLGRQPIARTEANRTTWIHPNYQNSPLLETSSSGAITRQPVYLGYGRTDSEGMSEIPGYTGAAMDAATGQTYLGARYLYQNRFTSPDPADLDPTRPAGLNRYTYADNNPVRYVDPDGWESRISIQLDMENRDLLDGRITEDEALANQTARAVGALTAISILDVSAAVAMARGFAARIFVRKGGERLAGETLTQSGQRNVSRVETEIVQRVMSRAELKATRETGLIRGGRPGTHHVSNSISSSAGRARQRLALPNRPEVRVIMEVPSGIFSPPSRVLPNYKMPGGGLERKGTGKIPATIKQVDDLKQ